MWTYHFFSSVFSACELFRYCRKVNQIQSNNRPRGKENTEVRISQNKGKESELLPKIGETTEGQAH